MKKTAYDIEQELRKFIFDMPLTKPEDMVIGDLFVELHNNAFGRDSVLCFEVVSKTATLLRYKHNPEELDGVKPLAATFKSLAKVRNGLRRISTEQMAGILQRQKAVAMADEHQKNFTKRSRDVHVVWNHAYEDVGPESKGDIQYKPREGFVLEVYNGNGELQERVRMMTEGNDGLECARFDTVERMVTAYAVQHFDHDDVRNGAKFQITYAPEID